MTLGEKCSRIAAAVKELLRTHHTLLVSAVDALLCRAGLPHLVLDHNMSLPDDSLSILPPRPNAAQTPPPAGDRGSGVGFAAGGGVWGGGGPPAGSGGGGQQPPAVHRPTPPQAFTRPGAARRP